ncbi:hypothetical protein Tco_0734245 [Tanacetum coccineum]
MHSDHTSMISLGSLAHDVAFEFIPLMEKDKVGKVNYNDLIDQVRDGERVKSIALKAEKESSDDETLTSGSDDEEYAMAIRNFKKFFKRKDCPKPPRNKDQKAFIRGSWSDSENDAKDKTDDETCLMAQSSNEVCLRTCLEPNEWIIDGGCSKLMTGNKSLFSTYKAYDGEEAIKKNTKVVNNNNKEDESIEVDEIVNIKESKNHPLDLVIGNLNQTTLRSQAQNHSNFFCFISMIEPKDVKEELKDESWAVAIQEELNQFIANDVWKLVPLPMSQSVIGTKWVFRNKLDEIVIVSRNKARLVA